ncbi:3-hydroxymyristoyl/3-hydroxydecanoyl-(acyl carrier protein) dehydratase [Streptomyces sp. 2323.1]|uniref:hypothetical protein n=1 Tax=Streptomyces sp. 2323.1 TaxID=1938841 RepID=UPI000BB8125F|nr:hypothetical protein [Streptomyces sp. 2323.1]SOE13651.1 3-hydroxymyristoyl/3-hydroxydecanoyl-(acyl carrier protein) dehydratase [Streptomyces sp. 2323.1]
MTAARQLPLTAVDGIEAKDGGFVGRKKVSAEDPYLSGHFPSLTVYPGVFLIEGVQQMLELHLDGVLGGIELVSIESARFSRPVLAGDEVLFDTRVTGERPLLTTATTCTVDGRRCARIAATWRCAS